MFIYIYTLYIYTEYSILIDIYIYIYTHIIYIYNTYRTHIYIHTCMHACMHTNSNANTNANAKYNIRHSNTNTIQYNTIQYRYNTIQCNTLEPPSVTARPECTQRTRHTQHSQFATQSAVTDYRCTLYLYLYLYIWARSLDRHTASSHVMSPPLLSHKPDICKLFTALGSHHLVTGPCLAVYV